MSSARQTLFGSIAILATLQPYAYPLPQLRGLGSFVASNATEFRWNLLLFSVGIMVHATTSAPRTGYPRGSTLAGFALLGLLLVGFAEYAAEDRFSDDVGLWGAPLHLLLAAVLPLGVVVAVSANLHANPLRAKFSAYTSASVAATGLAALGLLWNFAQTSLAEGWAWDWIESGPVWALGGLVLRTHLWAKLLLATLPPYVAFLSLSRTALITSAHHLQSPQSTLNLEPGVFDGFAPSATAVEGSGLQPLLLLALAVILVRCCFIGLASPKAYAMTRLPRARRELYLPLACACAVFHPALLVPISLTLAVRAGLRWFTYTLALHSGFVLFLFAGVSLIWWVGVSGLWVSCNTSAWLGPWGYREACRDAALGNKALLGGGGWLYFRRRGSVRPGRCVWRLPSDELCDKVSRFYKALSARSKLIWYRPKCNEPLLG